MANAKGSERVQVIGSEVRVTGSKRCARININSAKPVGDRFVVQDLVIKLFRGIGVLRNLTEEDGLDIHYHWASDGTAVAHQVERFRIKDLVVDANETAPPSEPTSPFSDDDESDEIPF